MNIKDKVIIVTGASSGIGEAAAKLLASKGAKVALAARSEDKLTEISKSLPDSFVIPVDMTSKESIMEMIKEVIDHYGRVDVLINNAGRGTSWKPVEEISIDDFKELMELNVYGPIIAMQQVIPLMRKAGAGSIVNIGSGTVYMTSPGASVYPGTKVLLRHISKVTRNEVAQDNIAVSVIHPYITDTNFFKASARDKDDAFLSDPEFMKHADSPEMVAEKIAEAIETGVEEINMSEGKGR